MDLSQSPRIWVTGMWGFEPEKTGYVGFTKEGPRTRYIRECQPGDLMMIIGQRGEYSKPGDVGRVLGLVELEPVEIIDTDRMSSDTHREKVARGWRDRWTFAMPVKRAWKIGREVKAKFIAPITCSKANARAIGATALLLTDSEVETVLRLPVRKVAIYGEPEWIPDAMDSSEVIARVAVSHGPPPSFGTFTSSRSDGENKLYVMELSGDVNLLFPRIDHKNQKVLKIGRSNDVVRRESEMNSGFPPGCNIRWRVSMTQTFSSGNDAHDAEQKLLRTLERGGLTIGREFAVIPTRKIDGLFASVSGASAFLIKA